MQTAPLYRRAPPVPPGRTAELATWCLLRTLTGHYYFQVRKCELCGAPFRSHDWSRHAPEGQDRTLRPPHLNGAYDPAVARLGEGARRFFDGSALGLDVVAAVGGTASVGR